MNESGGSETVSTNYFAELCKVNVSQHVEKKGRFSYLSWAWAVQQLGILDPTANWEVKRFNGLPYLETPLGFFVEVAVSCKGVTKSQIHPVLDQTNKPKQKPTVFDINTSIQRALVKAIALHGLGLYIYAGEDLPEGAEEHASGRKWARVPGSKGDYEVVEEPKMPTGPITPAGGVMESLEPEERVQAELVASIVVDAFEAGNKELAYKNWHENAPEMSTEQRVAAWALLDSKMRSTLKKMHAEKTNAVAEQA
jgi:hypothetical protein